MLRLDEVDRGLLDLPRQVLARLRDAHGVPPELVMLVGARCRDILHSAYGHRFPVTATSDVDFGLALTDWTLFEKLTTELIPTGSSGVTYFVGSVPVDLMPFGAVEQPPGSTVPPSRGERLDVAGFADVFAHGSIPLHLDATLQVKMASQAGYTALKLKAWADRSLDGQYKDAGDLALACYWYCNDEHTTQELWEQEDGLASLERHGYDQDLAAIDQLGRAVRTLLSPATLDLFRAAWDRSDPSLLAAQFGSRAIPAWPTLRDRRQQMIQALTASAGLTDT